MFEPKANVQYWLVKLENGNTTAASYKRFTDGSAIAVFTEYVQMAEEDPKAWKKLWDILREDDYLLLSDAKAQGIVPPDWSVPAESSHAESIPPA